MKIPLLTPILLSLMLCACSQQQAKFDLYNLPDFYYRQDNSAVSHISPSAAAAATKNLAFRKLSKATIHYFERQIMPGMRPRQKAILLRNLLLDSSQLDFDYKADKTLVAQQAFAQSQGNCISFSHLYLALARQLGLDARYQLVDSDPTLVFSDKSISLLIHINVVVFIPGGTNFIADNVPNQQYLIPRGKIISDRSADALHFNDLAITAMFEKKLQASYRFMAKAISLEANLSLLWSNLGALYRHNQQAEAAELSLYNALILDHSAYPALNNLAVLYHRQEDYSKSQFYLNKIKVYKEKNPYHHYNLALLAIHNNNYPKALKLVKKSIRLKDNEAEFYYQKSLIYELLSDFKRSQSALLEAINITENPVRKKVFQKHVKDLARLTAQALKPDKP